MRSLRINYNPTDDVGYKHDVWERICNKYNLLTIAPDDGKQECLLLLPPNKIGL